MEIFGLILMLFCYTLGAVTVALQVVCYKRKIEYFETILFTTSFLFLIITISLSKIIFLIHKEESIEMNLFISISMILLGVTTPLNIRKERVVNKKSFIKYLIFIVSGVLFILTIIDYSLNLGLDIQLIISIFLFSAVIYSMFLVRTKKPVLRFKHRDKIERYIAKLIIIVLPFTLFFDFFAEKFDFLRQLIPEILLTLPLMFIIIIGGKFLDDIERLSLFKQSNNISTLNISNFGYTKREAEVVSLLLKGYTYNQISEQLFISLSTVKTHVSNIYKKAEVNNKIELLNRLSD